MKTSDAWTAAFLFILVLAFGAGAGIAWARSAASERTVEGPLGGHEPIVIGHRGASGYRPEHTLASYELAIEMGADFIEPDLVMTKDGALVARHENEISGTTDVAVKFPGRRRTKTVDGKSTDGFFVEDFTLAEIKSLRARERLPRRDHSFDGQFEIPTFDEILDLVSRRSRELGRAVGVYPEVKHPTYHRSIGMALEPAVVRVLTARGWIGADAPVILQSFEPASLREYRALGVRARLILLYEDPSQRPYDHVVSGDPRTYGDLASPLELRALASVIDGIGPSKRYILPAGPDGRLLAPTSLIRDAHAAGLFVHPYTFRSDPEYLAPDYAGDPEAELRQFFTLGVDGVFADFPDHAVRARGAGQR